LRNKLGLTHWQELSQGWRRIRQSTVYHKVVIILKKIIFVMCFTIFLLQVEEKLSGIGGSLGEFKDLVTKVGSNLK
jgi:hypothetical protein